MLYRVPKFNNKNIAKITLTLCEGDTLNEHREANPEVDTFLIYSLTTLETKLMFELLVY